ncbi:MAG: DUF2934 domain-containing protein [Acidobacteriia bacterium]|nr:DUF2934 domain-containing protein [Terriglobia bacterium]
MPRVKRAQTTKTSVKPATSSSAEPTNGNANAASDLDTAIRVRAYELYEQRGRVEGFAHDDWFQAETEMRPRFSRTV